METWRKRSQCQYVDIHNPAKQNRLFFGERLVRCTIIYFQNTEQGQGVCSRNDSAIGGLQVPLWLKSGMHLFIHKQQLSSIVREES